MEERTIELKVAEMGSSSHWRIYLETMLSNIYNKYNIDAHKNSLKKDFNKFEHKIFIKNQVKSSQLLR